MHTDKNSKIGDGESIRDGLELVNTDSKNLVKQSTQYFSMFKGQATDGADDGKGKYTLIRDIENFASGIYDKPLPCFGCGIGWFSFLCGFMFPVMWYYATIMYFGYYYRKDPRERAGLAASAIAAMACTVVFLIVVAILLF